MAESMILSNGKPVMSPFEWMGVKYQLEPLTGPAEQPGTEQYIFRSQFENLLGPKTSVVRQMFVDRMEFCEIGIMAIKSAIQGSPAFNGIYPGDGELGMAPIRPMHVGDTTSTPDGKTSWAETITTANTRQAWIGASANDPFLVGGYSGELSAGWGGLIVLGVGSLSLTSVINELKFYNDREERVPFSIEDMALGDNVNQVPVYDIPTELYMPASSMYTELNGTTTGATENFKIFGLCVGTGKLLKRQTF